MRHARRGFTLVEVLVVIGIILLLMGLLVAGFRHLNYTSARKETVAELHICRGMLTEYENHNGLTFLNTIYTANPPTLQTSDSTASGTTDMGAQSSTGDPRYASNAVTKTQLAMRTIELVPENRNIVQSVQSKRILEPPPGQAASKISDKGAVLLDGWGNPIILVPAGGLYVNMTSYNGSSTTPGTTYVVRTSGTYPSNALPPLTAADRPFFASAGQDGDFTEGEDNVYSFNQD